MKQVVNCKERFGYAYVWTTDRKISNIFGAYCEGHSFIWRMFFGWRKTTKDGQEFYWLPKSRIDFLIKLAEDV